TSAGTSTSTASTTRRGQVRTRARAAARTPLVRAGAGLLVTAFLRHGVSSWQKRTHPIRPMGRPLHRIDAPNNDEGAPLATKTIVELRDDLDGGPAQHTVRFALEDSIYEIDLNSTNRDKLVAAMAPFAAAARRVHGAGSGAETPVDARAVREWARVNGVDVPARGRIPDRIIDEYRAAGN